VTGRIIIHAGFAKCGSTSIQAALFHNFARLQKDGVCLFGKELRIAHVPADLGVPLPGAVIGPLTGLPPEYHGLFRRYSDDYMARTDPDLDPLRGDDAFTAALEAPAMVRPERRRPVRPRSAR